MKYLTYLSVFAFLLLLISIVSAARIDDRLIGKLSEGSEVDVVVLLKDSSGFKDFSISALQERAERANSNRAGVLEVLDAEDFHLTTKFALTNGFAGKISRNGLEKLENNPLVSGVYLDEPLHVALNSSVDVINARNAWAVQQNGTNLSGQGVRICVIDTGVDYTHPALGGCLGAGCKVIAGYDFVNSDSDPIDDNGHGTHVAGIIISSNGTYRGVAPGAELISLKACDSSGSCPQANIISAIDWCIANSSVYNISIISMSLTLGPGPTGYDNATECDEGLLGPTVNSARAYGLSMFIASGNDGKSTGIGYPACCSNATAVGATYKNDSMWSSTNSGSLLDLLAPGVSIFSTVPTSGCTYCDASRWMLMSGTSMATPHAAGAAALLVQYKRMENGTTLSPNEIEIILKTKGTNITDLRNGLNISRIDVFSSYRALDLLAPTISALSPISKVYGSNSVLANISLSESTSQCSYSLNGSANASLTRQGTSGYYKSLFLPNGNYNITFSCNDSAGNFANKTINFSVAASYPQWAGNKTSASNNTRRAENVSFNITLSDDVLGGSYIFAYYEQSHWENTSAAGWTSGSELSVNKTIDDLKGSVIKWYWWFTDSDGNVNSTSIWNFTIANTPIGLKSNIPEQRWYPNSDKYLFMGDYISDIDGDIVGYLNITSPANISIDIFDFDVTFTPAANWTGTTSVVFNISDGDSSILTNVINLTVTKDYDADGYDSSSYGGTDCNDNNSAVNSGASEVCGNGIDDNCDGETDEGCSTSSGGGGGGGGAIVYGILGEEPESFKMNSLNRVRFSNNNQNHTIYVKKVMNNSAIVVVMSEPIEITLYLNSPAKVDVDFDGIYDISMVLEKIDGSSAYIRLEKLLDKTVSSLVLNENDAGTANESISGEDAAAGEGDYSLLVFLGMVAAVIAIVLAVVLVREWLRNSRNYGI